MGEKAEKKQNRLFIKFKDDGKNYVNSVLHIFM